MECADRFLAGVQTASLSFYMMWRHKKLLVYYGVVAVAQLLLTLCTAGMFLHMYAGDGLSKVLHFLMVNIFLQYIHALIIIFLQVSISIQIVSLLQSEKVTIVRSLQLALRKWQPIVLWSVINFVATAALLQFFYFFPSPILYMPVAVFGFSWSVVTLFVPIAVALEKASLLDCFYRSVIVVRNYLFKLIGGMSWIALIMLLLTVPVLVIGLIGRLIPWVHDYFIFICMSSVTSNIVSWIMATVTAIFKTKLYLQYRQGVEELQQLQYPDM